MTRNTGSVGRSPMMMSGLAALMGLGALGCASFANSGAQPPTQNQTIALATASLQPAASPEATRPTTEPSGPTTTANNSAQGLLLQANMDYREARKRLLKQGWRPNLDGEPPNLSSTVVKELYDLGYEEIKDCAGTGEGPCRFEFVNAQGEQLVVVATPSGGESTQRAVRRWWIEPQTNANRAPTNTAIASGFYALGGTDQGLEVDGDRYRYYDELGTKPWQSIADLKSITQGVIFDGKNYWCLSTLAPKTGGAACSARGWNQTVLPFVGTRFFNFLGGSGTGQSITIAEDGYTTVKLHGTVDTAVLYRGQFVNPLKLNDKFGLLLKDNKIYQIKTDGEIAQGCKTETSPCESDLYER